MTRKQRRLTMIALLGSVLSATAGIVAYALTDTISYYKVPGELAQEHLKPGTRIRLGGLVKEGSLDKSDRMMIKFVVQDAQVSGKVEYALLPGVQLPDLFAEGQGVVAEGALEPSGVFKADKILAKHDEKYMAREVADKLKEQGHWIPGDENLKR